MHVWGIWTERWRQMTKKWAWSDRANFFPPWNCGKIGQLCFIISMSFTSLDFLDKGKKPSSAVLSIRASSRPKPPATGQSLVGYFRLTLLLIFGKKLKITKRSNRNNCQTSASNVWVEIKVHFRSFKRVYLSHTRWKLIEGLWNACDHFTEQDPARIRLKIMRDPGKIIL